MEPQIVEKETFTVVGMLCRSRAGDGTIPQMWQDFGPRAREIKNMVNPMAAYGVCDNMDTSTGEFDYVAGFEVNPLPELPEGMVSCEVPGGKYAVVTCTLPTLDQAYMHVYKTWLPQSGFESTGGPDFELYDERFDPQNPESVFDVYIPVK